MVAEVFELKPSFCLNKILMCLPLKCMVSSNNM